MTQPTVYNRANPNHPIPAGAVYVGRPTKWGNPFKIGHANLSRLEVVEKYKEYAVRNGIDSAARRELKGKSLVCWCAPHPCHADLLLKWANEEPE